jgi:anthocyanidin 3-O-glucosyltransferase
MIGRPFFSHQTLNGRVLENVWEIGLQLESGVFTKHGVLNSLDKVLSQDGGENEGEHKGTSTTRKERHWTKRDLWIILLLCQM